MCWWMRWRWKKRRGSLRGEDQAAFFARFFARVGAGSVPTEDVAGLSTSCVIRGASAPAFFRVGRRRPLVGVVFFALLK